MEGPDMSSRISKILSMGLNFAMQSFPKIDVDSIDGFGENKKALELINDAQSGKIAIGGERFQDTNIVRPVCGTDEKAESDWFLQLILAMEVQF